MTSYDDYKYCPNCGWTGHFIEKPYANFDWIKYGHDKYVLILPVIARALNLNYTIICEGCDWKGKWDDMVSREEGRNIKRTKLIDRMLELCLI